MKKIFVLVLSLLSVLMLASCAKREELTILNVGDYIDDELVEKFEKEYHCKVIYNEKGSNEEIYQAIKNDNYDIIVVSDYLIDRLVKENRLLKLDYNEIPNYKENDIFSDALSLMNTQCKDYKDYFIPYFWGSVGILYNTEVSGLKEYVEANGLKAVMEKNNYKVGMYNSARDALCLAALSIGATDINTTDENILTSAKNLLKSAEYDVWGEDDLKDKVHRGLLDLALVYSGDYLDEIYQCEVNNEEVNFDFFAPSITNIWIDGMVIMSDAKNPSLAYKFLNFMNDYENAAQNAYAVGYCPLSKVVYDMLYDKDGEYQYDYEESVFYPYDPNRLMYKYVSDNHYQLLNRLLEEAKQ